uniref:Uncharacterized protein n=1 Tax=Arundo donax TaxID=35708 RepID=A0A0A9DYG4_ARUDO
MGISSYVGFTGFALYLWVSCPSCSSGFSSCKIWLDSGARGSRFDHWGSYWHVY